jgi:hypothetical protein
LLILWWAQQDSNLRLPPCEGFATWSINNLQVTPKPSKAVWGR